MALALVAGALANRPGNAGGAWVRLSWATGLRLLGFDVVFLEQIDPAACVDAAGTPTRLGESVNLAWFRRVLGDHGLDADAALIYGAGEATDGRRYSELLELAASAELLVNLGGHLALPPLLRGPRVRVFIDLDPGYTQHWHVAGARAVGGHDAYYTIGLNIGSAGCSIPTGGIRWRPIRQPVVLEQWPRADGGDRGRFTTVGSWRGPFGPVPLAGRSLGGKVHEFRRFWSLPCRTRQTFEIALQIDRADQADRDALSRRGWIVADPATVAGDPDSFRSYVSRSSAEFSPAQSVYVQTASGWFSDRTVRYLVAGRPALVQDTGFSRHHPCGDGLVAFRTLAQAVDGARAIQRDYEHHRRAARELAETFFDARVVLGEMLTELGVAP